MTHYFFSPHPDDAALSCGGQIATLTRNGESVVVLTIMAGDPPVGLQPSPHITELWERWNIGSGAAVSAERRAEDQSAWSIIGAPVEFWPWLDAIYRLDSITGQFIYPVSDSYFTGIPANDPLIETIENADNNPLIRNFVQSLQNGDTIHCPLSVGGHADHRLVRRLLQTIRFDRKAIDMVYYEEYPYSAPDYKGTNTAAVVQKALERAAIRDIHDTAETANPIATIHVVDSDALSAKIAAINCYHSQISSFWPDSGSMANSVQRYTTQVGGEREWRFIHHGDKIATPTQSSVR